MQALLTPVLARKPAALGLDLRFYGDVRNKNYTGDLQVFVDTLGQSGVPIVLAVKYTDGQLLQPLLKKVPANIRYGSVTLIDRYYPESDNVVRRVRLFQGYAGDGQPVFSFALQMLAAAEGLDPMAYLAKLSTEGLPDAPDKYRLINYSNNYRYAYQKRLARDGQQQPKFRAIRAKTLLQQQNLPALQSLLAEQVHDSTIVLVGATFSTPGKPDDWFRTPLTPDARISGVVVHANILNWLLSRSFISEPSLALKIFLTTGLILISWAAFRFLIFWKAIVLMVVAYIMYILAGIVLFAAWEIWLPVIWPVRIAIYFVLLLALLDATLPYWWKKKLRWLMPYSMLSYSSRRRR